MLEPNQRLINPAVYSLIVATNRADIASATDAATAARASVAARDPAGAPAVWEVAP